MRPLNVAVLGATGAVGREMWRLLEASDLAVGDLHALGTRRSRGRELAFRDRRVPCRALEGDPPAGLDLVLASAGAEASREWSPRFAAAGAVVVDNSSAFRMDPACPLVIPEVNPHALGEGARIVANPNCSTIQMVLALAPLHREWGLVTVKAATYQSVSGAGTEAQAELDRSTRALLEGEEERPQVFPHPIGFNMIPQIGPFEPGGETFEERKMRDETRRILGTPGLAVSATCVRVPVRRGHSEAVWASFGCAPDPDRARELLASAPGIRVLDEPERSVYPLPRAAVGSDDVFVGRIRRDPSDERGLCLWIVADNLLKGAATNAWQIAWLLVERGWLPRKREA